MKRVVITLVLLAVTAPAFLQGEDAAAKKAPRAVKENDRAAQGPLAVHPKNPRYFTDGTKNPDGSWRAVYLTGSHTWGNLSDNPERKMPFDNAAYLDFLEKHNHNFIRLWSGYGLGSPCPYERTGPGKAADGGPQVDLDRFNPAFFEQLRSRVQSAGERGIYVGVMLFNTDWVKKEDLKNSVFYPANNIQGLNGDTNGDEFSAETFDGSVPRITAYQEAYVRKVLDAVNDLDNVLYEIGNEGDVSSVKWQYRFIDLIRQHEAKKAKQHPVGMTAVFNIVDGSWKTDNDVLFKSKADWISPGLTAYQDNPPAGDGRKVIIADVDHIWPAAPQRGWIWKCFLRGLQPIHMDSYTYENVVLHGISRDEQDAMRKAMGHTLGYSKKMNLAAMTPQNALASTEYCLAEAGVQYLIYQPVSHGEITVNLLAGDYDVEWFDPASGAVAKKDSLTAPDGKRPFTAPFDGEAVLYLALAARK